MEILKKVILIIMLVILSIFICIYNLENGFLLSAISIAFIAIFVRKVKIKKFSLFLVIFSLITKIIGVLILKSQMGVDYQTMYDASLSATQGDFSFINKRIFLKLCISTWSCILPSFSFKGCK